MANMRHLFGALLLLLMVPTVFADTVVPQSGLNESQVFIVPGNDDGRIMNISVFTFPRATSATGTSSADLIAQWAQECAGRPDRIRCIENKSLEHDASSRSYDFNIVSLMGAHVVVEYLNPYGTGNQWTVVPGCEDVVTSMEQTVYMPDATGAMVASPRYIGQCDLQPVSQGGRVYARATFVPQPTESISPSDATHEYSNIHVTPATQFAQDLNNFIIGVSQSGGQDVRAGGQLPCLGLFMIMGLLLASLYFAGKSPISLLDITTPKLPSPKGVTAGGQILAPFGYTEMKRVAGAKMAADVAALRTASRVLGGRQVGDAETERLASMAQAAKGTAADKAAGDMAQGRQVAEGLVRAGRSVGMRASDLQHLAMTLPYHYGDAEQRTVAQILQALEARGGRDALMAMTFKDYFYSLRTMQSLETLTAHPGIGQRSAMHYRLTSKLGKFYGSGRYAILSGVVMSGTDSIFRTGRVVGRMSKAMVTEAPNLARGTARTTMEMLGGRHAMENLQARAKTSPTASWVSSQMQRNPSQVVIGAMFPINDKMAHLYRTLHSEAVRDEMRYVLRQLYRKYGMRFDVDQAELANMGHTSVDILKRSNYQASAQLSAAEAEMRKILSNTAMSSQEKLSALTRLAESHGAHIDHQMTAFNQRLAAIETAGVEEHQKLILLNQALEDQNKVRTAVHSGGGRVSEDAYQCHVGGSSLKGPAVWEQMVLRTMIWDAENGFLRGGIKEAEISAILNVRNRLTGLDPSHAGAMEQLPEYMRNPTQLKAVAEENRRYMTMLFDADGLKAFEQRHHKAMSSASIAEMVDFAQGGLISRTKEIDKKTGRMTWRASDAELELPKSYTLVDMKRHWVPELSARDNFAIGQWVESKFTRSYVPPHNAALEAEANRMAGSASWSIEQRTNVMKKLWVTDQLMQDMEQRFNSHFGQNAYGTTRETMKFYGGIVAGFMDKALQEKGLDNNHPDRRFLENMDLTSPKHMARLNELFTSHREAYQKVVSGDMTYDGIAKANKAVVMLHEGGFAYYQKGMMLSDLDRVMAGSTALRDEKGVLRPFIPEDVAIKFAGRDDLQHKFQSVRGSKDAGEWRPVVEEAITWAKAAPANTHERYERERVLAAVLWEHAQRTYNYEDFWKHSAVSVEAKRSITPVAPSVMRFFGSEGHNVTPVLKPFRDIGMHGGDYISRVALAAGGELHRASYDITPVSSQLRMHSFHLASKIQSGELMKDLTPEEQKAYRAVANSHGSYVQVWQYAIDRNPWRLSTSLGAHQSWASSFNMGPSIPFRVDDNLRAYMGKGEYMNFMSFYGFAMNTAGKIMTPYTGMIRGLQMSMQGYACKWDGTGDALRAMNYTEPRLLEAMQSMNPMSFKWFPGKRSEQMTKLNGMGGSLERHQLSGSDFLLGLKQAPQDIFLYKKGTYANARTFDVNPAETIYNYRLEMKADQPMAEYLWRTKDAAYIYDRNLYKDAMDNTTRRTVSAEALAIRRDQELRGFGMLANPIMGWANPLAFLWHMPVPGMPQSLTPKEMVASRVRRKHGYGGGGFGDNMRNMAEGIAQGTSRLAQPHKVHMIVYCPKCNMSNYRGSYCKNAQCKTPLY